MACGTTSITASGLIIGSNYWVRVYSTTNATGTFNICITDPAPANNACAGAVTLTSGITCVNTTGNVYAATNSAPAISSPNCASSVIYDVWYKFVAQTINPTITLGSIGSSFTNTGIQILSNNCGSTFTPLFCGTTSIAADYLVPGTTYYIRVFSSAGSAPTSPSNAGFTICVTDQIAIAPFNDECENAVNLPIWNTCNTVTGEMAGATASSIPLGSCSGPLSYDVWYKFTAINASATITLSSIGSNFLSPNIQIFSGTCGALTSIACGTSPLVVGSGLTPGAVYYIRVYSTTSPAPNGNAGFKICATTTNAPVRFGNTYVNVTKKTTGGIVQTGDILEIRMTISHTSGTMYSLRYVDNIPTKTAIAPAANDSIWIRTNEGLTYKRYSLGAGDDAGTYIAAPPAGQYNIRLNLGFGGINPGIPVNNTATEFASATGRMVSTDKPKGGGGLLFATAFRVVVTGNPGDTITLNPGQFIYQNSLGGPDITLTAIPYKIVISNPLSLCSNSIGINSASEFGGTFGSGTAFNRNADLATPINGYTFVSNVSPNVNIPDGRYAIVKNSSPRSGIVRQARQSPNCNTPTTLAVNDPYNCNFRMFGGYWYVDGDHSGTTNAFGNVPPGINDNSGYMLLVNADYVASEVYRQTITNLCPNTYYEFSAWVRNICPNCGIDSLGSGTSKPGVYPNLTFLLNDVDLYNTGEVDTLGWLKKGFVFKTGSSQTNATFSIRNNSQGGGGNDWALDDIAVATCFPNMTYSPTYNPTVCSNNTIVIRDTVRSYFDNYVEYKWQKRANGTPTWIDIPGESGTATPVWNGTAYEYIRSHTIPPGETTAANNGDMYRLVVASTSSNLGSATCSYTDPTNITLNVITTCGPLLKIDLLSVSGNLTNQIANVSWITSKENEEVSFSIERSEDAYNFRSIGQVKGFNNSNSENNHYSFNDPEPVTNKIYYRVVMINSRYSKKYSDIIQINPNNKSGLDFGTVISPFINDLTYEVYSPVKGFVTIELVDSYGRIMKRETREVKTGLNSLSINNTSTIPGGMNVLRASINGNTVYRKVMKAAK
jgi:hypothetical protein